MRLRLLIERDGLNLAGAFISVSGDSACLIEHTLHCSKLRLRRLLCRAFLVIIQHSLPQLAARAEAGPAYLPKRDIAQMGSRASRMRGFSSRGHRAKPPQHCQGKKDDLTNRVAQCTGANDHSLLPKRAFGQLRGSPAVLVGLVTKRGSGLPCKRPRGFRISPIVAAAEQWPTTLRMPRTEMPGRYLTS